MHKNPFITFSSFFSSRRAKHERLEKTGRFSSTKKPITALLIAAVMACSMFAAPRSASAFAVGVIRFYDSWKESSILAASTELQNYIKDILTNLDGLKSIASIADLPNELQSIFNGFDITGEINKIKDQLLSKLTTDLSTSMQNKDVGGGMESGEFEGKKLDDTGVNIAVALAGGDVNAAANIIVDRVKKMIEENYKLNTEAKTVSADKTGDILDKKQEKDEEDEAENTAKEVMKVVKEAAPMSFAGMQESAGLLAAGTGLPEGQQKLYAQTIAENSKKGAMQEITKVLAPYTANKTSKASYRYGLNKIREKSKAALSKATELSSGGPSKALKTIAGLSAVMVEQQGLQNELLANLTDIMADDIKMSGLSAIMEIEGYSNGVQANIMRYIDIYNKVER